MELTEYALFGIIFLYISNWFHVHLFLNGLFKPKETKDIITDVHILSLIKRKTGLALKRIEIINSNRLFGAMVGIPRICKMVLSRGIYTKLNKDELEWVLLHEAGHCVLYHTPKCAFVQGILLILGMVAISKLLILFPIWIIPLFGLFMSLISTQFMRYFEYEADNYSIARVDNPEGVISAQAKFAKDNPSWFYDEKNLPRKLFYWNILPSQRIEMAKGRLRST